MICQGDRQSSGSSSQTEIVFEATHCGKTAMAARRVLSGRVGTLPSAAAGALHSRALSTALAPEQGGKHVPFGEAGTGAYTSLTKGCFDVIDRCKAIAEVAVDRALASRRAQGTSGSTPFTIADFGTADGGTSLPLGFHGAAVEPQGACRGCILGRAGCSL